MTFLEPLEAGESEGEVRDGADSMTGRDDAGRWRLDSKGDAEESLTVFGDVGGGWGGGKGERSLSGVRFPLRCTVPKSDRLGLRGRNGVVRILEKWKRGGARTNPFERRSGAVLQQSRDEVGSDEEYPAALR